MATKYRVPESAMRVVPLAVLPRCSACGGVGRFDGPSPAAGGSWMYACRTCAGPYGLRDSRLTTRLVLAPPSA